MNASKLHPDLRVLLIGGSSHVGKTTVARSLAERLGWSHMSTDSLARHPGRPWAPEGQDVPERVANHYLTLSPEELIEDVLRHYRVNVWPLIAEIVAARVSNRSAGHLILEGSALWPEPVAAMPSDHVASVWLTADDDLFRRRIQGGSRYARISSPRERKLVDRFLERTVRFNRRLMQIVNRLGLPAVTVDGATVESLADQCLDLLDGAR